MVAEIFNYILFSGPCTLDQIARGTQWGSIAAEYAITVLLAYHFIVEKGEKDGKPCYDIPIANEGE